MNFALIENKGFLPYIKKELEKDGHSVVLNRLTPDIEVCIIENDYFMYNIYRILKIIKKNKIKLVNFVNDMACNRLEKYYPSNSYYKIFIQFLTNITQKNKLLYDRVNKCKPDHNKGKYYNFFSERIQQYFNRGFKNRLFYQKNKRKYLKYADLNLSISKYTQKLTKKFLKLDTHLCYQCVNSDYLSSLPKVEIKYDAINISSIFPHKRQDVFVKAANKLNLNILVLGRYFDHSIELDCPHYYYPENEKIFEILNQTKFYVDASEWEGFGMTPVEAAFLDKISIVSNTYLHRDVLGDYPLYFEVNNIPDLVEKMKIVIDGGVKLNNAEIKKNYSSQALKKRLMKHIESLF